MRLRSHCAACGLFSFSQITGLPGSSILPDACVTGRGFEPLVAAGRAGMAVAAGGALAVGVSLLHGADSDEGEQDDGNHGLHGMFPLW
jgi:hypothetical protein